MTYTDKFHKCMEDYKKSDLPNKIKLLDRAMAYLMLHMREKISRNIQS